MGVSEAGYSRQIWASLYEEGVYLFIYLAELEYGFSQGRNSMAFEE